VNVSRVLVEMTVLHGYRFSSSPRTDYRSTLASAPACILPAEAGVPPRRRQGCRRSEAPYREPRTENREPPPGKHFARKLIRSGMLKRHYTLGFLLAVSLQASEFPPHVMEAARAIEPGRVEAHVHFLADDLLEGRGTGTRGHEIAARYVATRFHAAGLEPGGESGSWYQSVPLREAELVSGSLELLEEGEWRPLVAREDFILYPNVERAASTVEAPLTFAGYGVSAPEIDWDDYEGIDVEGRIVVVLRNAPPSLPNNQRAYYASPSGKRETAAARGAIGLIEVSSPREEDRVPWTRVVQSAGHGSLRWLGSDGKPHGTQPGILAYARLSRSGSERLFGSSFEAFEEMSRRADAGEGLESFHLEGSVRMQTESRHRTLESPNVVALLEGSDPELRGEAVLFIAHLDHIGLSESESGTEINNGAYDNASGVAAMLEAARAMAAMEQRPRRSLVFLAVTGEEKGLLGSDYFAHHQPEGTGSIVAAFSLDMFLMLYPLHDIAGIGAEHSSLGGDLAVAASALGIAVSPDPTPEEVVFIRTDHYPFVRKGVPALFLAHGHESGDPAIDGGELTREWRKNVYHTPRDDLSQSFDWEAGADFARLNLLLGWRVADSEAAPRWNPGDFFGETFGSRD
jgi:hypothetical protein